ncbi:PPE domain-containing protein [Mycobacterium koreense]|uniref:PPE family protein n=1 Tax=Mycolicibacillus koreensis TaxID=1069220 RepID=A0A7I7SB09_9MYCO|nr:PPE domain-containing protein [Mycolicibacillus koreensis]MCV7247692.1 PPE domain-containing protein [Mycolicibacillus koreensis]OSC34772.1 PPE family protein [Mycolicibacillus koreensis]BBY54077.1 hypothetical protein MKOR_13280 [Mycolicibacillus koreensis]
MPMHPWGASRPEMNSGVIETGSTSATWMAASAAWMGLSDVAMVTMGIVGAQMFASTTTISGIRSLTHEAATPPFLAWLATMAGIAAKQAAVTEIVAGSYGMTRSSMIPSVQSITNRVNERAAEATNFFGQNTPLIAELNTEYAEYTAQNAALGTTYGEVITAATLPTPIPPPPPLGSLATTAGDAASSLGDAASQIGQAAPQAMSQAASQGTQGGEMSQMFQAPMQAAQSAGQALSQGPQGLSQLMQAPAQAFGQISSLGSLMNGGSTGDSFSPALGTSGGGLPLGAHSGLGSGAGAGSGVGSGAGAGSGLGQLARAGSSSSAMSKNPVLSGISTAQEKTATSTGSGMGRGGMMPAHGGHPSGSSRRARDASIVTATTSAPPSARREAKGAERDLFS